MRFHRDTSAILVTHAIYREKDFYSFPLRKEKISFLMIFNKDQLRSTLAYRDHKSSVDRENYY